METLIIYAYYETDKTKMNLNFFLQEGIINDKNYLYVIVVNGDKCSVTVPEYDNVIVLRRQNIGFDFGAHGHALEWVMKKYDILPFKFYIFLNASVIGPFMPPCYPKKSHWPEIFTSRITNEIKLVGTTISCLGESHGKFKGPKVGGYFFVTDDVGLNLLLSDNNIFMQHENKISAIAAEYRVTDAIMDNGYNIDCLLYKYQNYNWRNKYFWEQRDGIFPDRQNSYFGISIHPFEVIFHKWYWSDYPNNLVNFEYCQKYTQWKTVEEKLAYNPFYPAVGEKLAYNPFHPVVPEGKLSNITNGIIECAKMKKKYVIIDYFYKNPSLATNQILNLTETTKKINQCNDLFKNIVLFDRTEIDLNITKAEYGYLNQYVDVTEKINNLDNIDNCDMNEIFGIDPSYNNKKILSVEYKINNHHEKNYIMENDKIFTHNIYLQEHMFKNYRPSDSDYRDSESEIFLCISKSFVFIDEFKNLSTII